MGNVHLRGIAQIAKLPRNQGVAFCLGVEGDLMVEPERGLVPRPLVLRRAHGTGSSLLKGEGVTPVRGSISVDLPSDPRTEMVFVW